MLEANKSKSHFRYVTLMLCWLIVSCVRFLVKLLSHLFETGKKEETIGISAIQPYDFFFWREITNIFLIA